MTPIIQFKDAIKDQKKWDQLELTEFESKTFEDEDIEIAIQYCGVCGSDVHTVSGGWGECILPMITGHEIAGTAVRVGPKVKTIKVGDRVGVGAQACSCFECKPCKTDNENYCMKGVDTYNAKYPSGEIAHGGYANGIRVHERFVFPIPAALDLADAAPMLCGGLTVYSPLKRHGCQPGATIGVVGLGGLGHFAVLFAVAMGAQVTVFSHNNLKEADARKMGAKRFVVTEEGFEKDFQREFDVIVSTRDVANNYPILEFCSMLTVHGRLVLCGLPDKPLPPFLASGLAGNGAMIVGSHIGSKLEALEMLQLAAEKGVKPWIQKMPMKEASKGLHAVHDNSVRYRGVLEMDIN